MTLLYLPFILQGASMVVDEFYFHEKRGLPLWEKLGHPLDTLTVFFCYAYLLWGSGDPLVYIGICSFSCLFITKDEFVHTEKCSGSEHWLHAMLFVLHPLSFLSAYYLFQAQELSFLKIQTGVIFSFMLYQALRWSIPWQRLQTR